MAGSGSPCGACKFLRRKCVSGCVFAPYFCHQQGAAHFAAIHKVFGASNASKLLLHLPVSDRLEAAFTISYEARARLLDPIYGCVAHIFALVLQVLTLEAQLTSLKAQKAHSFASGDPSTSGVDEDKLSNKHACHEPASDNKLLDPNTFQSSQHWGQHLYMDFDEQFLSTDVNSSCAMASLDRELGPREGQSRGDYEGRKRVSEALRDGLVAIEELLPEVSHHLRRGIDASFVAHHMTVGKEIKRRWRDDG